VVAGPRPGARAARRVRRDGPLTSSA
jgi:hypothetical protein